MIIGGVFCFGLFIMEAKVDGILELGSRLRKGDSLLNVSTDIDDVSCRTRYCIGFFPLWSLILTSASKLIERKYNAKLVFSKSLAMIQIADL